MPAERIPGRENTAISVSVVVRDRLENLKQLITRPDGRVTIETYNEVIIRLLGEVQGVVR